jgi:eukaryotic-like serine/threonine-protein kinase
MGARHDEAARVFEAAVELGSAAERAAYLDAACGQDPRLRAEVEELLAHDGAAGIFLDRPARPDLQATAEGPPVSEGPGAVIGPYKLLEQLGEGGFGVVYLAEQARPVRRKVALKVLKPGMDSRQVVARFEAERQALALMDHPNIARVLDGGTTDTGRPYFVMELVKGVPLTAFCDQSQLSTRARLRLFVDVCSAVQHAHQKGIIHRDLKPSNVLVTAHDTAPVAKVIDFGIAKALGQELTEKTLFTGSAQMIGTPLYMSPEQAGQSGLDVDTRSDVYSLGVLLYELLTGATPFDKGRFQKAGYDEIRRIIREEEPPRPSTRLSTLEDLPSIAAQPGLEPKKLSGLVRGELDWIVMKCLEKDRNRRYDTANGLAMDVQRYLAGEPVLAVPPSAGYRLRKFARKHGAGLTMAAALTVLLVAGAAVSAWQAVRATRERDAKELARQKEEQERRYAQAIADFVIDDFLALTSVEGQDRFGGATEEHLDKDATLRQLLDRAAGKLNRRADLDPRTEADLRWMIGVNYRALGESGLATPFLERCVVLRKDLFGPDHEQTLRAQNSLALGYQAAGKLDLALPLFEETLALQKAKLGADHTLTLTTMNNLATGYRAAGKLELALPLYEEALALRKAMLGPDDPLTLTVMNNLATGYRGAGKLDLALPLFEEALALQKAKLGADHTLTLISMNNLAESYRHAGKLDLALPLLEETLALRKTKSGADHPDTLACMNSLAIAYRNAGKLDLAVPLSEETLVLAKVKLGADHPDTLTSMNNLASGYLDAGKLDLALPLFQEAAAGIETRRFQHQHAGRIVGNLIACHEHLKQFDRAEPWRRKWLAVVKERFGADSVAYAGELASLGLNLLKQSKWADAEAVLRDSLAIRERKLPDDWRTFNTRSLLGEALLGQKRYAEAEPLLLAGYEGLKGRAAKAPMHGKAYLVAALERLVQLCDALEKKDEAAKWRKELDNQKKKAAAGDQRSEKK